MADAAIAIANKPAWVDLGTSDPAGARAFYAALFGWDVQVNPDPQYGGYALAKVDGKDVAGIGSKMSEQQPTAWSLYIGSDDAAALGAKVEAAGGRVLMPAFDVGDQGKMAVYMDPTGAMISTWQRTAMGGFQTGGENTFGWAELNARGFEKAIPFYESVFGWEPHTSNAGGQGYTEFHSGGESIAGGQEIGPETPAEMPSWWTIYFYVPDVDAAAKTVEAAGGKVMVPPMDFPGGRFAWVTDPQGAIFGILKMAPRP